jgi:hypothetical protein
MMKKKMTIVLLKCREPNPFVDALTRWHRLREWEDGQIAKAGWIWFASVLRMFRVLLAAGLWPYHFLFEPLWDYGFDPAKYDTCNKVLYTHMDGVPLTSFSGAYDLIFMVKRQPDPGSKQSTWSFPVVTLTDLIWHLRYGPELLRLGGGQMLYEIKNKTWLQLNWPALAWTIGYLVCIILLVWFFPFVIFYSYVCLTLLFSVFINNFDH